MQYRCFWGLQWIWTAFIVTVIAVGFTVKAIPKVWAAEPAKAPAPPIIAAHDVPNFHVVYPYLWRGAAPTDAGLRALKVQGVRTVIDLRISPRKVAAERRLAESLGLHFINLPMGGDPPTTRQIQTFLKTATSVADQPVFLHCQHGADRTGTMMGIYRERVEGWGFDRTYMEMRHYGFDPRWKKLTATVRHYAPAISTADREARGKR